MKNNIVRVWAAVLLYWFVFGALCTWLYPVVLSDVITRYAPMADHFAIGDFQYAFHPRFGVIFQVLSGSLVYLTGMGGDKAVQLVSIGFVALAGVPLYLVMKRVFNERIAWWALALLLFCDHCNNLGMAGLRDSGKCLVFALIAYGVIEKKSIYLGLGLFVLTTLVSYGFACAAFLLFLWYVYYAIGKFRESEHSIAAKSLIVPTLFFALGTAAVTWMTHAYTGHWLPSSNFIKAFGRWL